jgi:NADH-quinone oxidoreductase subunit G
MVSIEIDGRVVEVEQGTMIIEAADCAGIGIPRFCYHKKLSIAANCRMCLVEVANAPKPLPACATPVAQGMVIKTKSKRALDAQKAVMEFLLINHPLDCPICDQGGECELQDVAMGYGQDFSRFQEGKRTVADQDIGPFISTDLTRCIHCTRCVRFGEEVAGLRELGATGRGERMTIGTYIERSVKSEISGNVIDLCPVGALTSKPFRFKARSWELLQYPGIAAHDCLGSHLYHHVYQSKVARVVPRENEAINEVWLSNRDRFSYEGYTHPDRLQKPMIKHHGKWEEVDWETAFSFVKENLQSVLNTEGPDAIGTLASPNMTLEEGYLLQKWLRALGIANMDHRLLQQDFRGQMTAPLYPQLNLAVAALEAQPLILLVGSDIQREQPLAAVRLRKAASVGSQIFDINPIAFGFDFPLSARLIPEQGKLVQGLVEVLAALNQQIPNAPMPAAVQPLIESISPSAAAEQIAATLIKTQEGVLILGELALTAPDAMVIQYFVQTIASVTNLTIGTLSSGANAAGAWINGIVPHRGFAGAKVNKIGLNAKEMLEANLSAYILGNLDPECDLVNSTHALSALKQAKAVIAFTPFTSETLEKYCHVLLPITPVSETSGTFVNVNGQWQSFIGAAKPFAEARPAWKVLRVLGNVFGLDGFDYTSTQDVLQEVKANFSDKYLLRETLLQLPKAVELDASTRFLTWVATRPAYAIDNVSRRSKSLCAAQDPIVAKMNAHTAHEWRVENAHSIRVVNLKTDCELTMDFEIDEKIPNGVLWMPYAIEQTAQFGCVYDSVSVTAHD